MKYIQITRGNKCLVDDENFESLNKWSWCFMKVGYAARRKTISRGKTKLVYMHREVIQTPIGMYTDHINGDRLDNRKCNLRICTKSENSMAFQKKKKGTSSKFFGVSLSKERNKWEAYITIYGKRKALGRFKNEIEAAEARDKATKEIGLDFFKLNFPTPNPIELAKVLPNG